MIKIQNYNKMYKHIIKKRKEKNTHEKVNFLKTSKSKTKRRLKK
jgi:hypothetical protein